MQRSPKLFLIISLLAAAFAGSVSAQGMDPSNPRFFYRDFQGRMRSTGVIHHYWHHRIVHPLAQVDPRINPKLMRAASIAEERSNAHSKGRCWQYVKEALLNAGAVNSYPKTAYAAEAGGELVHSYGFTRLSVRDPYSAPVGSVLVYSGGRAGHVEIRTRDGFASDYHSKNACYYHLIAAYAKLSS
jgi:hypothetical protein